MPVRDPWLLSARARPDRRAYGMGLGIMLLDDVYPGFPGDVRNASGWPYPVQYEIIEGVDIEALVDDPDKSPCLEPTLAAARKLERMGCRAIVAECGYFGYFQVEVAAAVNVPVFMSSLLQVPLAQQLVGPGRVVGILMSDSTCLLERHLLACGIRLDSNYVIAGAMDHGGCPEFVRLWDKRYRGELPQARYTICDTELVNAAVKFYGRHPKMGAMVLECTGFSPFARSIQRAIDIPVLSWGTMLDYAYGMVAHRDYYGHI